MYYSLSLSCVFSHMSVCVGGCEEEEKEKQTMKKKTKAKAEEALYVRWCLVRFYG